MATFTYFSLKELCSSDVAAKQKRGKNGRFVKK